MGRIRTSLELFKASWAVIRHDKELLALPIISAIASLITIALFAIPVLATLDLDLSGTQGSASVTEEVGPATYILLGAAYLMLAFVSIFFNAALVHAANERMSGGDPTLGSAIGGAASRLNRIAPWAIVSATVSMLIRQLQERAGILGSVLGFLGGLAWAAVTFLVLPILVIEDIGPVDAVKRSASLLRNAWGEGLAGHIGLGFVGFIAALPFLALGLAGAAVATPAATIPLLVVAGLGLVGVVVLISALSVVYQTALYRFATTQAVSAFDDQLMTKAFRTKKRK